MNHPNVSLEKIVSLCKRKGFVFQSAEIYGGITGMYDFGHLGALLRNNIKQAWLKSMKTTPKGEMLLLDGAQIGPHDLWKASGHIDNFHDPLVDNRDNKKRYRVDQLLEDQKAEVVEKLTNIVFEHKPPHFDNEEEQFVALIGKLFQNEDVSGQLLIDAGVKDPHSGAVGNWTNIRNFSLMFKTALGVLQEQQHYAYLRPETAQTIFAQFKNIMTTNRAKIPFGIMQVGKSFRNEITPKQFLFRMREFEQMEMEWFCHDSDALAFFDYWLEKRKAFYHDIGIDLRKIRFHKHSQEELAHYSVCCTDIQYHFPFGWKELEGIAHRGTFDLSQHTEHSGKDLQVFDQTKNESFTPTIVETSVGLDRLFLTALFDAYREDEMDGSARVYLAFKPNIAPIKAAVFPLSKKLQEPAEKLFETLKQEIPDIQFDVSGSIGKRYRRQDEIGTPFCITYDFDSEEDQTVTVRDRDTGKQSRIAIDALTTFLKEELTK